MTSHMLSTILISLLVVIIAIQLSPYQNLPISTILKYFEHKKDVLLEGGEMIGKVAQFGALILVRIFYTHVLKPLYEAISTRNIGSLCDRYGSWAIIMGDLHKGDIKMMREYAHFLIERGMNILIIDLSAKSNQLDLEDELRNQIVEVFLDDLRQHTSSTCTKINDDDIQESDDGKKPAQNYVPKVEMLCFVDDSTTKNIKTEWNQNDLLEQFSIKLVSKLGTIATTEGIGILVHCFSSNQVSDRKESKSNKHGTEKFLTTLNLVLPYMLFRGTGAIINTSSNICVDNNFASFSTRTNSNETSAARGLAECAFNTQLIRSIHYEYGEQGIDCLAVTISRKEEKSDYFEPSLQDIVKSSFQMIKNESESELDIKVCGYVGLLERIWSIMNHDVK
mmetsp:Transcript_2458/g.3274  ORF Transcript_2458/g.3274 Transcript_2458/m.3274 type:complete len:393 (-) Transcript_2458:479-1657(-)